MRVVQGIDRSAEAKGDTATDRCPKTIANGGAAEFIGSWWCCVFRGSSLVLGTSVGLAKPQRPGLPDRISYVCDIIYI
jgi:hypothetical protein